MVIDLTPHLPHLSYDMRDHAVQVARQAAGLAELARYAAEAGSSPKRVSPISQSTTCLSAS
jgi:hypothetical protein